MPGWVFIFYRGKGFHWFYKDLIVWLLKRCHHHLDWVAESDGCWVGLGQMDNRWILMKKKVLPTKLTKDKWCSPCTVWHKKVRFLVTYQKVGRTQSPPWLQALHTHHQKSLVVDFDVLGEGKVSKFCLMNYPGDHSLLTGYCMLYRRGKHFKSRINFFSCHCNFTNGMFAGWFLGW